LLYSIYLTDLTNEVGLITTDTPDYRNVRNVYYHDEKMLQKYGKLVQLITYIILTSKSDNLDLSQ